MAREKLVRARELIEQQRYAEARTILLSIDHPVAQKWLDRLDEIAPEEVIVTEAPLVDEQRASRPPRTVVRKQRTVPTLLIALLSGVIGLVIGLLIGLNLGKSEDGIRVIDVTRQHIIDVNSTTMAEQQTATQRALTGPSEFELTSTAIVNRNATTVAEIEATNAALTNVPAQSVPTQAVDDSADSEALPTSQDSAGPPIDESNTSSEAGANVDLGSDGPPLEASTPLPSAMP